MRKQVLHPLTEIINKKQKFSSKKERLKALSWLAKTFPESFNNETKIHPLKTGIMNDVLEHAQAAQVEGISKSKLREAVVVFTRRIDYLATLKYKESRINLHGQVVGIVSEEEAARAVAKLKRKVEHCLSLSHVKPKRAYNKEDEKAVHSEKPYRYNAMINPYFDSSNNELSYTENNHHKKTPAIIVKNKSSRQLDPNTVNRLKEKLGLTLKRDK